MGHYCLCSCPPHCRESIVGASRERYKKLHNGSASFAVRQQCSCLQEQVRTTERQVQEAQLQQQKDEAACAELDEMLAVLLAQSATPAA